MHRIAAATGILASVASLPLECIAAALALTILVGKTPGPS
jgi:hypothetical protein